MTTTRIGYVLKCYPRFSETFIVRELIAREAAGDEIVVASLRAPRDSRFHSTLAQVQAPVTWIPYDSRGMGRAWTALKRLTELGAAPSERAMRMLIDEEADVAAQAAQVAVWALENEVTHLHAHFATVAGRTARLASALTGLPWTVTAHAKDIFHVEYDPRRREQVITGADTVVAVSDSTADYLRSTFPTARVRRIYNGVEVDELAGRDIAVPADDRPHIAAVGRFVAKKGWPVLFDALALLRDEGLDVRTTFVGSGPLEEELLAQRDALGLTDLVHFSGPLPQHAVLDLVGSATVFAAPCIISPDGDRDGLPTVLLESMALGTAVVSTPVSGVSEAVFDGRTGVMAEPGDPRTLADALRRVIEDTELRERLVKGAHAHVKARFDVDVQARNLRELTAELAARQEDAA
ncbi:MAG: glycosyltransferase family 4 protein [Dermatophilus congolensis]|nr:glycosyltransferase family 4 protein [Dermatophilus congolensis]